MGKQLALSNYLASVRDKPFQWGEHDCVLHCVNAIQAMTGVDYGTEWRGTYSTRAGAEEIISRDLENLDMAFTAEFGLPFYNIYKAARGDVCRCVAGEEEIYGILDDSGRYVAAVSEDRGLVRLPLKSIICYWKVP